MNNKKKLSLLLIVVLALSLALGTLAYYRKTLTSDNNKLRAARFTVHSDGTLDGNEKFDLTDEPIYPGIEDLNVYEFLIDKTGTEVPVEYEITVTPYDELFAPVSEGDSPVTLIVLRKVEDGWVDIGGLENVVMTPDKDLEEFKIELNWGHSDYDIEYQGKPGKVKIEVEARQVDKEEDPGDPGGEDPPPSDVWIESARIAITPHYLTKELWLGVKVEIDGKTYGITSYDVIAEYDGVTYTSRKERFVDGNWCPVYKFDRNMENPYVEKATIRLYKAYGDPVYIFDDVPLTIHPEF